MLRILKCEGGRRRRGRPELRWKDYVKRDIERAGTNDQKWNTIAEDRGRWRELTTKDEQEATKSRGPHPAREQGDEEDTEVLSYNDVTSCKQHSRCPAN